MTCLDATGAAKAPKGTLCPRLAGSLIRPLEELWPLPHMVVLLRHGSLSYQVMQALPLAACFLLDSGLYSFSGCATCIGGTWARAEVQIMTSFVDLFTGFGLQACASRKVTSIQAILANGTLATFSPQSNMHLWRAMQVWPRCSHYQHLIAYPVAGGMAFGSEDCMLG